MSSQATRSTPSRSNAVPGASIYQMLVALWRANPQAFIQSNMNLLKAGQKLSIPDADAVRSIDPAEARAGSSTSMPKPSPNTARAWARRGGHNPTVVRGRAPRPAPSVVPAIQAPLPPRPPRTACACQRTGRRPGRKPTPRGDAKASAGHAMAVRRRG